MFHILKNTIFIILVILTIIFSCECKVGEKEEGLISVDSRGYEKGSNSHTTYGSSLGSSGINRHSSRHTGSSIPYPHVYNAVKAGSPYSHPNEPLPGGVNPPPGVKQPYGTPRTYNRADIYPNSNPSLGDSSHRTNYVSGRHVHLPPPPPPAGFLNTRSSGGAAPFYTYYIHDFLSRGSNSDLTAGLALWEVSKHRSHYNLYHLVNHGYHVEARQVPKNREIKPGETYIILPTDLMCSFIISGSELINILIQCVTNRNRIFTMVLPSNETIRVHCSESRGSCSAWVNLSEIELIPINFEIFNEIAVYGAPLCNTTVVKGGLEIAIEQYKKGMSPCVYPPYKWTGEEWINVEEKIQKEKIKENLKNVTTFEDKTLNNLARYLPFGNFFSMFSNNTK